MATTTTRHSTPRGLLVPLLVLVWFLFTVGTARAGVIENAIAAATQDAGTDQSSAASATAAQEQPVNVVISVRIDSPGDDGPITQVNADGVAAGSANGSTTEQGQGASGTQPTQQDASTGQDAVSGATATQDRPQNLVIIVRINSPGNNGPIQQGNVASAGASSGNVSDTTQGVPVPSGEAEKTVSASPPRAPRPRAHAAPAPRPRSVPRKAAAVAAPRTTSTVATSPRAETPSAPATQVRAPAHERPADRPAPADERADAATAASIRPVDLLGKLDPRPVLRANEARDISSPVVLTLIALLGALLVAFGSTHGAAAARLVVPRHRRRA